MASFGSREKCERCNKSVYAKEKISVDIKDESHIFHQLCFRCKECNKKLIAGSFTSVDGQFYCTKPCYANIAKTLKAEKGAKSGGATESNALASKFGGKKEVCETCNKSVFATERCPVEGKDGEVKVFHKQCLKCQAADCGKKLTMETLVNLNNQILCKKHAKEEEAKDTKERRHSKAFGAGEGSGSASPSRFGASGERCHVCDKRVYSTERLAVELAKDETIILHKLCFRCQYVDDGAEAKIRESALKEKKWGAKAGEEDAAAAANSDNESNDEAPPPASDDEAPPPADDDDDAPPPASDDEGQLESVQEGEPLVRNESTASSLAVDGKCNKKLDHRTFKSVNGTVMCEKHATLFAKVNPVRKGSSAGYGVGFSGVPSQSGDDVAPKRSEESAARSAAIASRFGGAKEKCYECGKSVYAKEKLAVELSGEESLIFHKACLKCAECSKHLTMLNFTQAKNNEGTVAIYCVAHKPKGEMSRTNEYADLGTGDYKSSAPEMQEDGDDAAANEDRSDAGGSDAPPDSPRANSDAPPDSPRSEAPPDSPPPEEADEAPPADDDEPPPEDDEPPPADDDDEPPPADDDEPPPESPPPSP